MLDKYFSKPLGVDVTPIGISKPCLELIPAVGGIIQSMVGASSQDSANRANLRATRETNEMNYKIAQEANEMSQQQFQKNMEWLREQFYDTDHMKRTVESYQKAGVNPALAYGQPVGASSVGSPSPSQFHVAQMDAGHVEPVNYADGLSESVGHAVDAYYNNKLRQAEATKVGFDAQISRANAATQMRKNVAELRSMRLDNEQRMKNLKKSDEEYKKLQLENEDLDWSIKRMLTDWDETSKQLRYGNQLLVAETESHSADAMLKRAQAAYQNVLKAWYPKIAQSQLDVNSAQIGDLIESARLKIKEGQLTSAKKVGEYLRNGVDALEFEKANKRYRVHNSNIVTRVFYGTLDEIGYNLFHNLKLFGK